MVDKSVIKLKYGFDKSVALLSIGGFYVEHYVERQNQESYYIFPRSDSKTKQPFGVIKRSGLIEFFGTSGRRAKRGDPTGKEQIITALDYFNRPKPTEEKPQRGFTNDISQIPVWQ